MAFFNEIIQISVGGYQVKIDSSDTTGDYLISKLLAGAGISLTENNIGLNETLTIAATGAGFSKLTPTGTLDGNNQTFIFTNAPTLISVDQGRFMQKVSTDGTVNWTGTTTIVLAIAPTFDIYGL